MQIEGFKPAGIYYDKKYFPWGFSKSGDFTIAQAKILEIYGKRLLALEQKEISPESREEKRFVAVCDRDKAASSSLEIAWEKYRTVIEQKSSTHTFNRGKASSGDKDKPIEL